MRLYTKAHPYFCGIDLHAHWMYLCVLDQPGEVPLHRNLRALQSAGKNYGFSGKKIGNIHLK
jgi:hypothetical protein